MQFQSSPCGAAPRGDQYGLDGTGAQGGERGHGVREGSGEAVVSLSFWDWRRKGWGFPGELRSLCTQVFGRGLLTGTVYTHALTVTQQQPPVASSYPCPRLSSPSVNSNVCPLDSGARLPSLDAESTTYLLCDVGSLLNFSVSVSTSEQWGIITGPVSVRVEGFTSGTWLGSGCGLPAAVAATISVVHHRCCWSSLSCAHSCSHLTCRFKCLLRFPSQVPKLSFYAPLPPPNGRGQLEVSPIAPDLAAGLCVEGFPGCCWAPGPHCFIRGLWTGPLALDRMLYLGDDGYSRGGGQGKICGQAPTKRAPPCTSLTL